MNAPAVSHRSRRFWRALFFMVMVAALALYVLSRWREFTETVSGLVAAVPATGNVQHEPKEDFLLEYKVDREKMQNEQVDMLKRVMDDAGAGKEVRDAAYREYLAIVDIMGKELKVEGLLKARNYDSVAFLSQDACTVMVRSSSLDERQVAMIGDTVRKVTRFPLERITVIAVP